MTGSADERERLLSGSHTQRGRIQRVVLVLLDQHEADGGLPTNGRFVFYELEQQGHATKPSPNDQRPNRRRNIGLPGGQQDITDELTRLRDWGVIPWSWIMDEERRLFVWGHAPTIAGHVLDRLDDARVNPWGDRLPPLIMSESKATAGVLTYAVAADYRCPITGTKGQSRGFLVTEVTPLLIENDRPVLYLGDSDKSGTDIEANIRRVLERETGRVIERTRLGMTEQLGEQRGIEPIWKVDGRTTRGHWAVEVASRSSGRGSMT